MKPREAAPGGVRARGRKPPGKSYRFRATFLVSVDVDVRAVPIGGGPARAPEELKYLAERLATSRLASVFDGANPIATKVWESLRLLEITEIWHPGKDGQT